VRNTVGGTKTRTGTLVEWWTLHTDVAKGSRTPWKVLNVRQVIGQVWKGHVSEEEVKPMRG
jgi:hypothetical protein